MSRPRSIAAAFGLAALCALALAPDRLCAQRVERVGEGEPALDARIDRLLAQPSTIVLTRDTLIEAADTVRRPLLIVGARLTLAGVATAGVVGVGANIFLRPNAEVEADVVNIAGGLYTSELATIEGTVVDRPLAPYEVVRRDGIVRIVGQVRTDPLTLDGFYGLHPPTYDRVDALTLQWGAAYRFPSLVGASPRLHGQVGYRFGRDAWTGALELALTRGATTLALGAERTTATNDAWIKHDPFNSLGFLWDGDDYRNYHQAERLYAGVRRRFDADGWSATARLRGQLEDAASLEAGSPWTILESDTVRPNPEVLDATITSIILGGEGVWSGSSSTLEVGARLELADEALGGDLSFAGFVTRGAWTMDALANHTLEVEWRFQGPLPGTESLPYRRWTLFGRNGPIETLGIAQYRGDRLVYVATEYEIPLPPQFALPVIGAPEIELLHGIGMAWTADTDRELVQNIGIGLQFFALFTRVVVNPEAPEHLDFGVGLSWPFGESIPGF